MIIDNNKKMGDFKDNIIINRYTWVSLISLAAIPFIIFEGFEASKNVGISAKIFSIIASIIIIILNLLVFKFENGIYEKGLIIHFKRIYWEDIKRIKIETRENYIRIISMKNKKQKTFILKYETGFNYSYIEEKVKNIEIN